MKILLALVTSMALLGPAYATEGGPGKGEMKEVCTDKKGKDGKPVMGKDGKAVQECRQVKVRKKVEGDKVPEKK